MDTVYETLKDRIPALGAWSYIAIWAVSEMILRMKTHPENPGFAEIHFPHTSVPLFSQEEAANLEATWREQIPNLSLFDAEDKGQVGGGISFPPVAELAKTAGETVGSALANVDPESFSIDKKVHSGMSAIDSVEEQLIGLSKQYGLIALESTSPDPVVYPLAPLGVPAPLVIPVRTIVPVLNAVLEMIRIASTVFPVVSILGKPTTLIMTLMDLARGNLYHAIFSFIGFFGKYPMYAGIVLKILRDGYSLISPDLRGDIRELTYKSTKSFVVGFMMWLFATVAPGFVRKPVVEMLDKVRGIVEEWNTKMREAEAKGQALLGDKGTVTFPTIPPSLIPSIGDFYILQQYIHDPRMYCHPQLAPLLVQMRSIPPLALFFDLLNIPAPDTREYKNACAKVSAMSPAEAIQPVITLHDKVYPPIVGKN